MDANLTFTTAAGGVTFPQATNIVREMLGRFYTTNSIYVTNETRFEIDLPYNSVCLDDVRIFGVTTGSYSRTFRVDFFRSPDFRRTYLAASFTNAQLYVTTSTVAQAIGSRTNVVNDASGISWPIDMYYQDFGSGNTDYVSYTNVSPTVLWQCCTNNYAAPAGSLISRVTQIGSFNYWDVTGGSKLRGVITPNTGFTGVVNLVTDGAKK
jgi:hypothetical protein